MVKPAPVILIEDDPKVSAQVADILRDRYEVLAFDKTADFFAASSARPNTLLIIDFDLKGTDGILIFKELKEKNPHARAIMISSSNNIPLAVSAAKQGILEFLRKPIIAADFLSVVEKLAKEEDLPAFLCEGLAATEWLSGASAKLLGFKKDILKCGISTKDLALFAERGINKAVVAHLVHINGRNSKKKLVRIDLSSYVKESLEGHFWAALNELLSPQGGEGVQKEEEQPGVIFIENIESVSEHFRLSIIDYLNKKTAREIKVILGTSDIDQVRQLNNFEVLTVPPLRERKEDLPAIMSEYLNDNSVSSEVLEFMSYYNFPGNYDELENLINSALPDGDTIHNLDFNKKVFTSYIESLANMENLASLRDKFEKKLINLAYKKTGENIHSTARFLNMPKTVLEERMKSLNL
ncbi:MAG: response regulator [Candidatus Margulisiibacteriota bacterium]